MNEHEHLANSLTAFIGKPLENPLTRSEMMEVARIALEAITAPAGVFVSPVQYPHRKIVFVVEDPVRGDQLFAEDINTALLERSEAIVKAFQLFSYGLNADGSQMTDEQRAEEARLTANPFKASNGVTVTWVAAQSLYPDELSGGEND